MKAVLVIDIPNEMYDKLHSADVILTVKDWGGTYAYPTVDVKPLPTKFKTYKLSPRDQEETELFINMAMLKVYADGYNACLEEIEK